MSWLSSAWDHNRNFLGNLAKNVSPLLAFTPLGPLGAGALGALGEAAEKGSNFGDILKSGASNAAIGAGAHSLYGAAKGALGAANGVGSAGGTLAPSAPASNFAAGAAGAAPPPPVSVGGISMAAPHVAALPASPGWAQSLASAAPQGASASSKLLSGLKGVGSFAKDNATVLGQAASGVLNSRENSQQLDFQKQQYADQQARQARIAAILGPLYQQLMQNQTHAAPNPYAGNPYRPGGA